MKKHLRKKALAKRNALTLEYREKSSLKIFEKLISMSEYKSAETVLLYASFGSEVDTEMLIKRALKDKKTVCLPRCIKESRQMEIVPIKSLDDLKEGAYGIKEPVGNGISDADLVIVPLVAFTKEKDRLGYGGGYYDRFLANADTKSIGIAFSCQIEENVYPENTDIKLQKIVTEKEVY
ncbi:MAG: 5-formyltetrahydrofolate cyclo-ligase [Clostridia bacterium]|nr:5-formyltetrahydrofolate cyclo-ligase [Clostridia bacterium]